MSDSTDKLKEMRDNVDQQVSGLANNIEAIQSQIDELTEQANAIETALLDAVAYDLKEYLDLTKIFEIEIITGQSAEVYYGVNYNVLNLTDWAIIDATTSAVLYAYNGAGWDSDSLIIDFVNRWNFGYDYLHRALSTSGTYGIYANIASLNTAKSLLNINKNKISGSKDIFEGYTS